MKHVLFKEAHLSVRLQHGRPSGELLLIPHSLSLRGSHLFSLPSVQREIFCMSAQSFALTHLPGCRGLSGVRLLSDHWNDVQPQRIRGDFGLFQLWMCFSLSSSILRFCFHIVQSAQAMGGRHRKGLWWLTYIRSNYPSLHPNMYCGTFFFCLLWWTSSDTFDLCSARRPTISDSLKYIEGCEELLHCSSQYHSKGSLRKCRSLPL